MISLCDRLRDLVRCRDEGLVTDSEFADVKGELLREHGWAEFQGIEAPAAPAPARRAAPAAAGDAGCGEDPGDVYPVPFPTKSGATSRADLEAQDFHNREMWEVFRSHPRLSTQQRSAEVARRWGLRQGIDRLREEVKTVTQWAANVEPGGAKKATPRRPGKPQWNYGPTTTHGLTRGQVLDIRTRVSRLLDDMQAEHDAVLQRPLPTLPAVLLTRDATKTAPFARKPHLYRILRTAEIASIDSHRLYAVASDVSLLVHLARKLDAALAAAFDQKQCVGLPGGRHLVEGGVSVSTLGKGRSDAAGLAAWRKLSALAAPAFSEGDLRIVSAETLATLLRHYGRGLTDDEASGALQQWGRYQAGDGGSGGGLDGPPSAAAPGDPPLKILDAAGARTPLRSLGSTHPNVRPAWNRAAGQPAEPPTAKRSPAFPHPSKPAPTATPTTTTAAPTQPFNSAGAAGLSAAEAAAAKRSLAFFPYPSKPAPTATTTTTTTTTTAPPQPFNSAGAAGLSSACFSRSGSVQPHDLCDDADGGFHNYWTVSTATPDRSDFVKNPGHPPLQAGLEAIRRDLEGCEAREWAVAAVRGEFEKVCRELAAEVAGLLGQREEKDKRIIRELEAEVRKEVAAGYQTRVIELEGAVQRAITDCAWYEKALHEKTEEHENRVYNNLSRLEVL
ncbi:hypothetical protein DIPPA_03153 [Diplonema papillatum]|nr:hypothetical protein DIPPA_03153 [Diplonema papillatum]